MELKERVGNNVDVDWRIIFSGNIWKLKEKEPGLQQMLCSYTMNRSSSLNIYN